MEVIFYIFECCKSLADLMFESAVLGFVAMIFMLPLPALFATTMRKLQNDRSKKVIMFSYVFSFQTTQLFRCTDRFSYSKDCRRYITIALPSTTTLTGACISDVYL